MHTAFTTCELSDLGQGISCGPRLYYLLNDDNSEKALTLGGCDVMLIWRLSLLYHLLFYHSFSHANF